MWCGVVWCGVVWCGVVWCGVVWCGVVWCGVVWCGVVWCGVVWCGVVSCAEGAVTKRQWPGRSCIRVMLGGEGCVCRHALCVVCFALVRWLESPPHLVGLVHGRPGDSLALCLLMQLQLPQGSCPGTSGP